MPATYRVKLHSDFEVVEGRPMAALWPAHKPLSEVLELRDTTPESIWFGTYQGQPTPPQGSVFLRVWWDGKNRFDHGDSRLVNWVVGRWLSWDTGLKDEDDSAYSALSVGELWPDYRLAIREVWRERLQFPDLPDKILQFARYYNRDGKLRGVLIEDKASGTSAHQTLSNTAESWLKPLLVPFMPTADKETRAQQAAVWCKNGSVLLPHPGESCSWLIDFEDELFDFPGSVYKDQVDSLAQLILWTENLLAEGWRMRESVK